MTHLIHQKPDPSVFEDDILPSRPNHGCGDFLMVGDTETDFLFRQSLWH